MSAGKSYWGGNFPEPSHGMKSYWGGNFPEAPYNPSYVPPVGPAGVGTFVLDLESGAKLKMSWKTDIIKARDATELQRISMWDLPRTYFSCSAYLLGDDARTTRAALIEHAADGSAFQLAITYEAATLIADSSGAVLSVGDTTMLDWMANGQRVIVKANDGRIFPGVIQSTTSSTIIINGAPGTIGRRGGVVMPTIPVLLDPQQAFARHPNPEGVELWSIECVGMLPGYQQTGRPAFAYLGDYTSGTFKAVTVISGKPGSAGNGSSLTLVERVDEPTGVISTSGGAVLYSYDPVEVGQDVADVVAGLAPWFTFTGVFQTPELDTGDQFGPAVLDGGFDTVYGLMGAGAVVTTYGGKPVWDRGVAVASDQAAANSMHALTELVDIGGTLSEIGPANTPDWGRQISFARDDLAERQWLKAFVGTVQGARRSFWMSTRSNDLPPVSLAPGELVVEATGRYLGAWYPRLRTLVELSFADGSSKYATITGSTVHLDGTTTLAITCSDTAYNPAGGGAMRTDLEMVSWLECCRLETDDVEVSIDGSRWSMKEQGRVVRQ